MERFGAPYRAGGSFEKGHGEAPPRLQVIGFTVCSPKAADAKEGLQEMSPHDNKPSPSLPKPAFSPRSALQQLLLNQSLPSTSPPSTHHSLPLGFSSSTPASSSPSTDHTFSSGLLQSAISPPAANQNWTSGASKGLGQSASSHRGSSGSLEFLLQSENASSDALANQRPPTSLLSSLGQSQFADASSSQNQNARGGSVSNQDYTKPPQVPIKESYDAFSRIKPIDDGINAKTHEIKLRGMISHANEVVNELPHVETCNQSSSLHCDEHPSAEKVPKRSWKGVQKINEPPFSSEKSRKSTSNQEKSNRSSLFIFVVSSPSPEYHDDHGHGEDISMDFLSSCHLCKRNLGHGEDVFMYSGDKAFCSMECRYQQIVIDERKERCPPPIIRSGASQVFQHSSITTTTTTTTTTTSTHHPIMINKPHFINTAAAA